MPLPDPQLLKALPIRRTNEVWEVAAAPMPVDAPIEKGGRPEQLVACVCVSNKGGATMSDVQTARTFAPAAGLQALVRFALSPHLPGAKPLNYLPARVHIASLPPDAQQHIVAALSELGVEVEIKSKIDLATDFLEGLAAHLTASADSGDRIDAPPLMRAKGMTVERIAAFADAAHAFWTAQPWRLFKGEMLWRITPAPKEPELGYCTVMGAAGQEFGLAFLPDPAAAMALAATNPADFTRNRTGTMWGVSFDPADQVPLADETLWKQHKLPFAAPSAVPFPIGVTPQGHAQRPTPAVLTLMEGLFRAFASLDRKELKAGHFSRDVPTFDGPQTLTLDAALKF